MKLIVLQKVKMHLRNPSQSVTPCDCADISYNVAKNGGVDAASASDNKKLEICNELLMDSPSFMAKAKDCPSWLKMNQLFKF